jgi:hypothetical protein
MDELIDLQLHSNTSTIRFGFMEHILKNSDNFNANELYKELQEIKEYVMQDDVSVLDLGLDFGIDETSIIYTKTKEVIDTIITKITDKSFAILDEIDNITDQIDIYKISVKYKLTPYGFNLRHSLFMNDISFSMVNKLITLINNINLYPSKSVDLTKISVYNTPARLPISVTAGGMRKKTKKKQRRKKTKGRKHSKKISKNEI